MKLWSLHSSRLELRHGGFFISFANEVSKYTAALDPKGRFACKEPTRCVFFDFFLEVSIIFPIFAGEYTLFKKSTI